MLTATVIRACYEIFHVSVVNDEAVFTDLKIVSDVITC